MGCSYDLKGHLFSLVPVKGLTCPEVSMLGVWTWVAPAPWQTIFLYQMKDFLCSYIVAWFRWLSYIWFSIRESSCSSFSVTNTHRSHTVVLSNSVSALSHYLYYNLCTHQLVNGWTVFSLQAADLWDLLQSGGARHCCFRPHLQRERRCSPKAGGGTAISSILYTICKTPIYIYVCITTLDFSAASGDEFVFCIYCTLEWIILSI